MGFTEELYRELQIFLCSLSRFPIGKNPVRPPASSTYMTTSSSRVWQANACPQHQPWKSYPSLNASAHTPTLTTTSTTRWLHHHRDFGSGLSFSPPSDQDGQLEFWKFVAAPLLFPLVELISVPSTTQTWGPTWVSGCLVIFWPVEEGQYIFFLVENELEVSEGGLKGANGTRDGCTPGTSF